MYVCMYIWRERERERESNVYLGRMVAVMMLPMRLCVVYARAGVNEEWCTTA